MRLMICLAAISIFFSCNNSEKTPDVSNIQVNLKTIRFEKELFALDTNQISSQLGPLIEKTPSFGQNFLYTILNADPQWGADTTTQYLKGFMRSYKSVYDSAELLFSDFTTYEKDIKLSLQYLKYYFPSYKLPETIITYIGPLDGYGDIISDDAIIVGLQHHLGKDFTLYNSIGVRETYPEYITNRFEPDYISINCIKNIVSDMYPEKSEDATLVVRMVEQGKRLYLLSKLLPHFEENKIIGYTSKQLKECYDHEASIWNLFVQNNLLQNPDNNIIKNYIGDSPKTQELGDASPGNIGAFAGWQIVKKFMKKSSKISLNKLMLMDAEAILTEAKYKP